MSKSEDAEAAAAVALDRRHSLERFGLHLACERLGVTLSVSSEGHLLATPSDRVTKALYTGLLKHQAALVFQFGKPEALSMQG